MAHGININNGTVTEIRSGKIQMNNMTDIPHTKRSYGIQWSNTTPNQDSQYVEYITVEDEEAIWKIEVPDIPKENIKAYVLGDRIFVHTPHPRNPEAKRTTSFILDEGETITSIKHDLGVLTFEIDRPIKRVPLEIK